MLSSPQKDRPIFLNGDVFTFQTDIPHSAPSARGAAAASVARQAPAAVASSRVLKPFARPGPQPFFEVPTYATAERRCGLCCCTCDAASLYFRQDFIMGCGNSKQACRHRIVGHFLVDSPARTRPMPGVTFARPVRDTVGHTLQVMTSVAGGPGPKRPTGSPASGGGSAGKAGDVDRKLPFAMAWECHEKLGQGQVRISSV